MAKIKLTKPAVDAVQPQRRPSSCGIPSYRASCARLPQQAARCSCSSTAPTRASAANRPWAWPWACTVNSPSSRPVHWRRNGWPRYGGEATPAQRRLPPVPPPTVKELCGKFLEDYSKQRNKPSTQEGYQSVIDRNIIPLLGRMKVQDVKRSDVAAAMKQMAHKPADANRTFSVMRRMFSLAEVWGYRPDGTNPCRHVPTFPNGKATHLISDEDMGKLFRHLNASRPKDWSTTPSRWQSACNSSSRPVAQKSSRSNGSGSIWKTAVSSGPTARPVGCPSP